MTSSWQPIKAGVPQGSILGPLLFLIFINDLPENLLCNPKLFADDVSLNAFMFDKDNCLINLTSDLKALEQWSTKWKMLFNPEASKPAEKVIFSNRPSTLYADIKYADNIVKSVDNHKHLGMILDSRLDFSSHINEKISKANQGVGVIKRLYHYLPRNALLQIYKSFIRPHLDYCDVIYHKPTYDDFSGDQYGERSINDPLHTNLQFTNKIESVQYHAALAITGCIRGTSKEKLYNELGLTSLYDRRRAHRLQLLYKIMNNLTPSYLKDYIPNSIRHLHNTRGNITNIIRTRTAKFQYSFFPDALNSWCHLSSFIKSFPSLDTFKKRFIAFFNIRPNSVYGIHNPIGLKYLSCLRVGLSHLRDHKYNHNFNDTPSPLCTCSQGKEDTEHYLLFCPLYHTTRFELFGKLSDIISLVTFISPSYTSQLLLFGSKQYSDNINKKILAATINFVVLSKRFDGPLFLT